MSEQPTKDLAYASPRQRCKDLIAHQTIVNVLQQIMGYELLNRSHSSYGHIMASDARLIFAPLTDVGAEELAGSQRMFVNCTREGLTGVHLELMPAGELRILTQACENQNHEQLERSTGSLALRPQEVHHTHLQALSWTACLPT